MQLTEYLVSITDYDFIRKTHKHLKNATNKDIIEKLNDTTDVINIIVSEKHCKLMTQNEFFEYEFYKNILDPNDTLQPYEIIEYYIINDINNPIPVCEKHSQFLKNNPQFNMIFYKKYPDLSEFKPSHLINHYIKNGKKENRQIC
jgi:hypothetical protein